MSAARPSWVEGFTILRERTHLIPRAIATALSCPLDVAHLPFSRVRSVVTTGVGSSLAHARYLAWLLRTHAGIPAWDVATGTYLTPPGPEAGQQALVIFSQGLSPNARLPLQFANRYLFTLLVTAAEQDRGERAEAVQRAREQGIVVVTLPCASEYEVLLRLVGPMVGYAIALRLARAAGAEIDVVAETLTGAVCEAHARTEALLCAVDERVFSDPVTLVATGGYGALAYNLCGKLLEGALLPWPAAVDAFELAHGALQEATGKPRTFFGLMRHAPCEAELFARARATLDPQHRWLDLEARLPEPLQIFEHEAAMNAFVLAAIAARRLDLREWPGKGRDAPLYRVASTDDLREPALPVPLTSFTSRRLDELTWPEVEARIAAGQHTVVVPLGAIEQHGPHLPLHVDTLVADALGERFCARVPESLQAPTIGFGCSEEHMAFPGTLSLSSDTLQAVLSDVLSSLARHGFRHLVVFSAHGGNDGLLAEAERELKTRAAPAVLTIVQGIGRIGRLWQEASAREGIDAASAGHHAGEFETSIMAALRPCAVRFSEMRPGVAAGAENPQTLFYPSLRANAPSGVVGDPTRSSAERAERYLDAWVDLLVEAYRQDNQRSE
jgi:creatinine amidohydrolase